MTNANAYAATASDSKAVPGKRHWLYRFVVLNALLITLPLAVAIAVYVMLAANGIQLSGSSGSVEREALLFALGYFVLPNLIMIAVWRIGIRRSGTVPQH